MAICATYILDNGSGVLTVGVTSDLRGRIASHRRRYQGGPLLVYVERMGGIGEALERKASLEQLTQDERRTFVEARNPEWLDLMDRYREPGAMV